MSNRDGQSMRWGESWYWRLRPRITPGLQNAQYAYFTALEHQLEAGDRWLDLGCGRRIAPMWMGQGSQIEARLLDRASEVVGIDPDAEALKDNTLPIRKMLTTAAAVPEPDNSFDLITANMVFEHLDDPLPVLQESARLLRPGGRLLIHTPNVRYPVTRAAACVPARLRAWITSLLEKRPAADIYPTRYRMNHAKRINQTAAAAGLAVVSIQHTADSPELIALGPMVALELCLIALTRTRLGEAFASNLVITLEKPMQQARVVPTQNDNEPVVQPSLGAAA